MLIGGVSWDGVLFLALDDFLTFYSWYIYFFYFCKKLNIVLLIFNRSYLVFTFNWLSYIYFPFLFQRRGDSVWLVSWSPVAQCSLAVSDLFITLVLSSDSSSAMGDGSRTKGSAVLWPRRNLGLLINGLEKHSRVCLSLYFLPRVGQTMSRISHTVLAEAWQISGRAEGNDGEAPA